MTNLGFVSVMQKRVNISKSLCTYAINTFRKGGSYIFVDYNKFIYQV